MDTTMPRPDPVPKCLHCRADAAGQYEASEGPRPLCEAHRIRSPDWRHYEPSPFAAGSVSALLDATDRAIAHAILGHELAAEAGPTVANVLAAMGGTTPERVVEVQAQLIQEAHSAGYDEGFRSGREQGRRDERARIAGILADVATQLGDGEAP